MNSNFHISLPCKNLKETIKFYTQDLGIEEGRSNREWVDFNLYGCQLTFVSVDNFNFEYPHYQLENEKLPSFHFGVILDSDEWEMLHDKINRWSMDTIVKKTFFEDKNGEQNSFFVQDPNGYFIEFKTFKEPDEIFI
ncbi:VOC family protein [Tenacibaculum jejuense]|uniref:Glyoxalase/bleomycin resistance protein/dioxygenase superfamily protein n=1 Tax=Tenacibaculum jejuense TaxID=584609 RepID=A0A238UB35_9FLAO|nr:VOC family protein [Tenacibaculum jejuense]SNR15788.1 Glyoxalase/bleomycin resistance protein/dioxygenase superfamily protein [Tenacibaculum jejuense]